MKENLELIRQACITANPAIMELGFGCEVKYKNKVGIFCTFGNGNLKNPLPLNILLRGNSVVTRGINKNDDDFEIFGRPIHLADVLFAVHKHGHSDKYKYIAIDEHGLFYGRMPSQWRGEKCIWNFLNDDLNHQSEETIAFLASLLK